MQEVEAQPGRPSMSWHWLSACVVLFVPGVLLAQASGLERTPWGTPDLHGTWDFRSIVPIQRPPQHAERMYLTGEELRDAYAQRVGALSLDVRFEDPVADLESGHNDAFDDRGKYLDDDLRSSLLVDPPNGSLPPLGEDVLRELATPEGKLLAKVRSKFSRYEHPLSFFPAGPEMLGLAERCLVGVNSGPPITPSKANNLLRIVQTEEAVLLLTEEIHDARVVLMDGRPRLEAQIERWQGDSRGHWDGDTLVVETTNFTDKVPAFYYPGHGAVGTGKTLRLIERFIPVAPGRLRYEFTVDDPVTFVRPFTVAFPMRATDARMFEFACHEANYSLLNSLKGARFLEAEAGAP